LKSRLFYKILISYVAIILFSVIIIGMMSARQIKDELTEKIKIDLTVQARIIALLSKSEIEKQIFSFADISRSRITMIGASGWVVADSEREVIKMDNHLNRSEVQEARIKGKGEAIRYSRTLGVDMLFIAIAIREGSEIDGYIRVARPLYEVKKAVDQLHGHIFQNILIVVISSLLIAFLFSRKIMAPIEKVERFTQKVCRGELPGTLLVESNDEIGRLAKNINCMVEEHQEKIRSVYEEKGKLESAFASMTEGVLVLDSQDRIELMNRGLKNILRDEYTSDIIGKTPLEAFRNVELENAFDRFRKARSTIFEEITFGDENPIILDVTISAVHGLPAGEEKTMMVFHDVTRLKRLEKMREDFVANVTHEIKTPLTAIIGFIDTLQGGALDEKETAKKFLQIISENAHRLSRLVDDLITLSSIELGEMKLQLEGVSVTEIIGKALPMFEAKAEDKSLTMETHIPGGLPLIHADRDKVVQIIVNILDNAVKFTPDGGKISVSAYEDDKGSVIIEVSDTGLGIPKSEIPRLGERFYRADKTRARELGGTGLGLSIVKHLLKAHQGSMEIDSQIGKGTTVSLYFPIYRVSLA
jgi:two-component system phosphate regulon sensor histidine kinase PhoR